jgi:hypothetical protein
VSHPDPALVDVRLLADHPLVGSGRAAVRMVATGSVTAGRYGLVEYRLAPHSPGAAREAFVAETAELRRSGRTLDPEERAAFSARHDQVMVEG